MLSNCLLLKNQFQPREICTTGVPKNLIRTEPFIKDGFYFAIFPCLSYSVFQSVPLCSLLCLYIYFFFAFAMSVMHSSPLIPCSATYSSSETFPFYVYTKTTCIKYYPFLTLQTDLGFNDLKIGPHLCPDLSDPS